MRERGREGERERGREGERERGREGEREREILMLKPPSFSFIRNCTDKDTCSNENRKKAKCGESKNRVCMCVSLCVCSNLC